MRRRREKAISNDADQSEEATPTEDKETAQPQGTTSDGGLDTAALDAGHWRSDGPWDIDEVDLADESAEALRIDLGSMIITGFPEAELRLQMAEDSSTIFSVLLAHGDSAIELSAYAAPRSGGLWAELRDDLVEGAGAAGGSAALAEGPFGVELRRLLPVTTPDGQQGYQPSRMWVAEGPRWLLRGILYGQAALTDDLGGPVEELLQAFRNVVVRRGEEPMAPGDLLPITLPQNLTETEPPQPAS